jgi:stage V sporulation protein R
MDMSAPAERLFNGADWDFQILQRIHDDCEEIAQSELGLSVYRGDHRGADAGRLLFGRHAAVLQALVVRQAFRLPRGLLSQRLMGLAYEIVINSSPCISYLMEGNTATMQALVIAHAAFGHNHFFKNNYLFKQWTDADGILDYLEFAKRYVAHCVNRHDL